jgi:hypothetical protein
VFGGAAFAREAPLHRDRFEEGGFSTSVFADEESAARTEFQPLEVVEDGEGEGKSAAIDLDVGIEFDSAQVAIVEACHGWILARNANFD